MYMHQTILMKSKTEEIGYKEANITSKVSQDVLP